MAGHVVAVSGNIHYSDHISCAVATNSHQMLVACGTEVGGPFLSLGSGIQADGAATILNVTMKGKRKLCRVTH